MHSWSAPNAAWHTLCKFLLHKQDILYSPPDMRHYTQSQAWVVFCKKVKCETVSSILRSGSYIHSYIINTKLHSWSVSDAVWHILHKFLLHKQHVFYSPPDICRYAPQCYSVYIAIVVGVYRTIIISVLIISPGDVLTRPGYLSCPSVYER